MKTIWKFTIRAEIFSKTIDASPLGITLSSLEEVRGIANDLLCEIKVANPNSEYQTERIEVAEPQSSPRLRNLLEIIEKRYGLKPWPHAVFDMRQRDKFFGVQRIREFTKREIDSCEYLSFGLTNSLGHAVFRTDEQFAADQYVTDKVANLKKDPAMGCLSPFQALVVMPKMRELLLGESLIGLDVNDEVFGSKGRLFKMGSSIILPRTLTRIVNMHGEDVDPDVWNVTTIHGGTEDHIYDDGHRPCIIRYRREEFEKVAPFDVAMAYEFIGNHKQGAYRGLIVSQKFRQLLKKLKVRGAHYFPIQLE